MYYGRSMRRALLLDGYLHCLLFVVGFDLFWLVGAILRADCANPALPPPSPVRKARSPPGAPSPPPSPPPLAALVTYTNCLAVANSTTGYVFIVTLFFMAYCTYRRWQMRVAFGFPTGSSWSDSTRWKLLATDTYAWVCCSFCALCQEARTLSYNNVIAGRWLGPQVSGAALDLAGDMESAFARQRANLATRASAQNVYGFDPLLAPTAEGMEAGGHTLLVNEDDGDEEGSGSGSASGGEEEDGGGGGGGAAHRGGAADVEAPAPATWTTR